MFLHPIILVQKDFKFKLIQLFRMPVLKTSAEQSGKNIT